MALIINDLYESFDRGKHLSDSELNYAFKHFDNMQQMLYISGPTFKLAAREARRVRDGLELIKDKRKLASMKRQSTLEFA
jgi:hypothetical protein